jgi:hypothetical protein
VDYVLGVKMNSEGFSQARLEVNFGVDKPVELIQLTLALQGMARDYRRYANDTIRESGRKVADDDIRLYVTEVKSGSIIATFASAAQVMGAFVPLIDVNPLFNGYVQFFGETVSYFRSLANQVNLKASDITATKAAAQAVSDVMAVAASQPGGTFTLSANIGSKEPDGSKFSAQITITSEEAAEAQRGALIAQKVLDYRGDADYQNVLLYFQRTSTTAPKTDGRTDDKAIINSISSKALPVHFASGLDAARITDMKSDPKQNPFKAAFRVDVNVESDRNKIPRFYRVVHIHEVIFDEDDT